MKKPSSICQPSLLPFPFFLLALFVAGCRTNKDILNDYEKAMVAGDYAAPVEEVEEKADDGGVDELLWRLHAGGSRYLLNDFPASVDQFDKAEDIFIRNDKTSVFRQGATGAFAMVSNDRAFPYAGGGEDRIFTCFYKAVDYMHNGRTDAARTELNRAAQHQDNWLWERKKEIADAAEKLKEDADGYTKKEGGSSSSGGFDSSKGSQTVDKAFANATLARKDWLNRYVQHATGVFRLASGDGDSAAYFREIAEIDPGNALARADLALAESGARPKDQVWIYVEDGLGPTREEWRLDLPTVLVPYLGRYVLYAGMALPYLRYRDAACVSYSTSAGGQVVPLAELQARIALKASQLGAAAWAASVTQADLRSWTCLPKKVYATRVTRPADGKVTISGNGIPVAEVQLPEGNSIVLVRKTSFQAPAVVKAVALSN